MTAADGGAAQADQAAALEDAANDGFGEIGIVEDLAPGFERLLVAKIIERARRWRSFTTSHTSVR